MGRYHQSKKEADSLKKIQIWSLKKQGYLNGWVTGTLRWTHSVSGTQTNVGIDVSTYSNKQYLRIYYTQTEQSGSMQDFDYKIPLTTTSCYFGGKRYWFTCPWYTNGEYCGRRVGVLYLGGKYFACRHCYNLTYNSRKLSGFWKSAGKVISIPELEQLEKKVRCKYYAGKMTRRYRSYLKMEFRAERQIMIAVGGLEATKPYKT